jgi:hypothetical protein
MDVLECLKELSRELVDLDLGAGIDHVQAPVDPLHFYREYVVGCSRRSLLQRSAALSMVGPRTSRASSRTH